MIQESIMDQNSGGGYVVSYILFTGDEEVSANWLGTSSVTKLPQVNDEIAVGGAGTTYRVIDVIDRTTYYEIHLQ